MIAYWERDCEWMGEGLQLAICPSFTGPTGLATLDVSGRSSHGTLTNMDRNTSWVTSGGKGALDFDNTDDRVDIAVLRAIDSGEVSFSFWYYPKSISGLSTIFNNWSLSVVSVGFYCFRNGQTVVFQQPESASRVTTGAVLTLNAWHHIVCRRANGSGGMRVFCNGVIDAASATAGTPQASAAVFNLCGEYGGTGKGNCQIDDFRIYSRALTAPEIRQLYERDRGGGMLYQPPKRRSVFIAAGFRAYWHRRQSQLIGGGL